MDTLLQQRTPRWIAAIAAALAAVTTLLLLHGAAVPTIVKQSVPAEVLDNCGIVFAMPLVSIAVFGMVYAWLILGQIPASHGIQDSLQTLLRRLAQTRQPQARNESSGTAPPNEPSERSAGNHPAVEASPVDPGTGDSPGANGAAAPPSHQAPGDSRTPVTTPEGPAPVSRETATGAQGASPAPPDSAPLELPDGLHPWLHKRLLAVMPTLEAHGYEAACEQNGVAAECDESEVLIAIGPSQICEWVLPLLGFIGTVWGLHQAIRPLSKGVALMMEAVGPRGTEEMRTAAMGHFTDGFAGLRIAFDTTLVGLAGVVVVGWLLHIVRGRAVKVLGEVQWATEEFLRTVGRSEQAWFQEIVAVLRQGLLTERDGQPQSRLGVLQETVKQGLTVIPGREGASAIPWFQHVLENLRGHVTGALNVLVRLGAWQLHEHRKQTQLQAEYIATDLRALRRKALPEERLMDDTLTRLRFEHVAEVEQNLEVQSLAVRNQAGSIAIGGYNRNAARRFLHEHRIDWLGRTLKVDFRPIYSEQAEDSQREEGGEGPRAHEPTGDVLGLTYSPDGAHLYLLCIDGLVRRFDEREMQEFGPLAGIFDKEPFVWLPGAERTPRVGVWRRQAGGHQYDLAALTDGAAGAVLAVDVREFLDAFERTRRQRDVEMKVRSDGGWLCFAGRHADQQRLVVCQRNGGPQWEVLGRCLADGAITAFDVCQRRDLVVFARPEEGIFAWTVGEHRQPDCLIPLRGPRAVSHLFLNPEGSVLVAVRGDEVAAFALDDPQHPRIFETFGGTVTQAAQSLDRHSVALATENNLVWLLNFRDPL